MNAEYYALPQIFDCMKNSGLKYWWDIVIEYNDPYDRIARHRISQLIFSAERLQGENVN